MPTYQGVKLAKYQDTGKTCKDCYLYDEKKFCKVDHTFESCYGSIFVKAKSQ